MFFAFIFIFIFLTFGVTKSNEEYSCILTTDKIAEIIQRQYDTESDWQETCGIKKTESEDTSPQSDPSDTPPSNTNPVNNESFFSSLPHAITDFMYENKYSFIALGSILTIYGYYRIKLAALAKRVTHSNGWSRWKKEVPYELFHELPQEKLAQDLINAIHICYANNEESCQLTDLLHLFIVDIKKEIKLLERFITLYECLKFPVISFFFPNFDETMQLAEDKLDKLVYLEDLVSDKVIELYAN